MKDGIIKGTGDSRYLKSSVPAGTTWEQVLTMLRDGTFPIDFNGINENGWQQLGTALNKANLLTDSTESAIGLTQTDPTVNDALYKLRSLITTVQNIATGRAQIQVGSYVGTNTYGASNPNSITCSFVPKLVVITQYRNTDGEFDSGTFLSVWNGGMFACVGDINAYYMAFSVKGNTLSWWHRNNGSRQLNLGGIDYKWVAFG